MYIVPSKVIEPTFVNKWLRSEARNAGKSGEKELEINLNLIANLVLPELTMSKETIVTARTVIFGLIARNKRNAHARLANYQGIALAVAMLNSCQDS